MSGYIADLLIKVDSTQIETATDKLKEFIRTSTEAGTLPPPAQPKPPPPPPPPKDPPPKPKPPKDPVAQQVEKDETAAYQRRLEQLSSITSEEGKQSQKPLTILRDEAAQRSKLAIDNIAEQRAKDANKRVAALQANRAQEEAEAEKGRYHVWLRDGAERTKVEIAQQKELKDARDRFVAQSNNVLKTRAKEAAAIAKEVADREIAELNRAHTEALRLDKERDERILGGSKKRRDGKTQDEYEAEQAEKKRQSGLSNLQSEFDPTTAELRRLDSKKAFLKQNQSSFNAAEYDRINKSIDTAREKAERYSGTLGRTALSAKQLRQAQAGLPAQFTDIVVSLQGGQAPLTVLLQQGGQIKDMFGGLGPAFVGVGSALKGLINPLTLAGAAMAIMGYAWYDGSEQLNKLNTALLQNGNAVGMSAGLLRQYASANGDSLGSIRENIDALSQLVANGKLVPSTYDKVAEAATSMASVTGVALDKIIDDFTSLGKEPVKAAETLNDKYNFLTASVHAQAQALVEQGKEQEASKLLTIQLADVIEARAKKMEDAATGVAKKWREVKNVISDAWTSIGEGLNPTLESELAKVNASIDDYARGREKSSYENTAGYQFLLNKRKALVEQLYESRTAEEDDAKSKRENAAAITAQAQALKKKQEGYTAVKKAQEELRLYDLKMAEAGDKLSPEFKKSSRQPFLDAIKKAQDAEDAKAKAKTPKSAVLDDTAANEFQNKVNEIKAQYASLNEAIKAQEDQGTISLEVGFEKRQKLLTEEAEKTKAAYQQQIDALEALKGAKNLSANQSISLDRKIEDARSKMTVAELNAQKELNKAADAEKKRVRTQTVNIDAYNASLQRMIDNLKLAGARERAGISQSSQERGVNDKLNSEDDRYNEETRSLINQRAENPELAGEVGKKLEAAARAHTEMKDQIVRNYEEMKVAQKDWGAGATSAFKQYIEDGENYAGLVNTAFTSSFTSMEDALVQFVSTGKSSFGDLTKSILADMARIAVKAAASSALSAILGSFTGGGSAGSTAAGYGANYLAGWGGVHQAKGGAWSGPQLVADAAVERVCFAGGNLIDIIHSHHVVPDDAMAGII